MILVDPETKERNWHDYNLYFMGTVGTSTWHLLRETEHLCIWTEWYDVNSEVCLFETRRQFWSLSETRHHAWITRLREPWLLHNMFSRFLHLATTQGNLAVHVAAYIVNYLVNLQTGRNLGSQMYLTVCLIWCVDQLIATFLKLEIAQDKRKQTPFFHSTIRKTTTYIRMEAKEQLIKHPHIRMKTKRHLIKHSHIRTETKRTHIWEWKPKDKRLNIYISEWKQRTTHEALKHQNGNK